jgi:predicted transcriptional regulator YdeE
MSTLKITAFNIIGIAVRTTNENGQMGTDIPALWGKFLGENMMSKIPNRTDDQIYCIYTDYEKDHTRPYTAILGCKVLSLDNVPDGMIGRAFGDASYQKFVAKGNLMEGAVFNEWTNIWNSNILRAYTADLEVYSEKSQDPTHAEVDIFIAVTG